MTDPSPSGSRTDWRNWIHEIIFEADTPAGKRFDVLLIWIIVLSVVAVMLDSISSINLKYHGELYIIEWIFTVVFTVEYILRLACVKRPTAYARSFFGIVDLLAVVPTYLSLFLPGSEYLLVIRILRVLRVFRVFKLAHYLDEVNVITSALRESLRKIFVFISGVLAMVIVFGALMYLIEGEANGFTSIPRSIYWAIVTMTTVGYGNISPQTGVGQFLAAIAMIFGYALIAVPTGIVTVELTRASGKPVSTQSCPECSLEGHDPNAKFCKFCGAKL
jgi:voltage-gated potassium channel